MSIRLHSKERFDALFTDDVPQFVYKSPPKKPPKDKESSPKGVSTAAELRSEMQRAEYLILQEKIKAQAKRKIEEKRDRQDRQFADNMKMIQKEKEEFLPSIDTLLELEQKEAERKRQRLFTDWEQNVFLPVQQRVRERVDAADDADLSRQKREAFSAYLAAHAERKGDIYLDIIAEHQYDPFRYNRALRVPLAGIDDPTDRPMRIRRAEQAVLGQPQRASSHVDQMKRLHEALREPRTGGVAVAPTDSTDSGRIPIAQWATIHKPYRPHRAPQSTDTRPPIALDDPE